MLMVHSSFLASPIMISWCRIALPSTLVLTHGLPRLLTRIVSAVAVRLAHFNASSYGFGQR